MAIEIRVESSWDTDDGEGRTIEVSVAEREHPWEDVEESTHWFAGGDLERLKGFLCGLIDDKAARFVGAGRRECTACRQLLVTDSAKRTDAQLLCPSCRS